MSTFLSRTLIAASLSLGAWTAHAEPTTDDIVGYWRTIDDKTGFAKAVVQIQKANNGTFVGTIVRTVPRPDYTPAEKCRNCPKPFTDRKIIGLPLLWNIKSDGTTDVNRWRYVEGYAIDPLSGKIYHGKAKVSADGRRLMLRGYIGFSALGRTQIWIREDKNSPLLQDLLPIVP